MNRYKILQYGLLIFTFIHLTMCPAVERISNGYIDHTVITKNGSAQGKEQSTDSEFFSKCFSPYAADDTAFYLWQPYQQVERFSSPFPAVMLSMLSTTRLIL